jgi:hypothetical protein
LVGAQADFGDHHVLQQAHEYGAHGFDLAVQSG